MFVKGLGNIGYLAGYEVKSRKGTSGKSFPEKIEDKNVKNVAEKEDVSKSASLEDIYDKMKQGKKEIEKAETDTDIIVRPDGSRVLVVTMSVGGMETTMSLEISKPTDMPNQIRQDGEDGSQMQDMQELPEGMDVRGGNH